jgi:hypothetical protein
MGVCQLAGPVEYLGLVQKLVLLTRIQNDGAQVFAGDKIHHQVSRLCWRRNRTLWEGLDVEARQNSRLLEELFAGFSSKSGERDRSCSPL